MDTKDRAFAYVRSLEDRVTQLEKEGAEKSKQLEELRNLIPLSLNNHLPKSSQDDLASEEKLSSPAQSTSLPNIPPVAEPVPANFNPSEDKDARVAQEAVNEAKRAAIRERVARAEKEREERLKAAASVPETKGSVIHAESNGEEAKEQIWGPKRNVQKSRSEEPRGVSRPMKVPTSVSEPALRFRQSSGETSSPQSAPEDEKTIRNHRERTRGSKSPGSSPTQRSSGLERKVVEEEEKQREEVAPKTRIKPLTGLVPSKLASARPVQGYLVPIEVIGSPAGEAVMTASVSQRDMYEVVEETSGLVFHRFEGTDSVRFLVRGLKLGATTRLVMRSSTSGLIVPETVAVIEVPPLAPPVPPRMVNIVDRQRTSVRFRWSPPLEDGGSPIINYEVELSEKDVAESFERVYEGSKPECLVGRLSVGTKYFMRVRAMNALGVSPFCQPSFCFTTMAATPSPPSPIRLVKERGDAMFIVWDPPEKTHGSEVSSYQVEMSIASKQDNFQIVYNDELRQEGVEIKSLTPYTTYKFRVRAENSQGFSAWSAVSELSTTANSPLRIDAPVVLDTKGAEQAMAIAYQSSITVRWQREGALGSVNYHLEARPDSNLANGEWETVYVGPSNSVTLSCDGKELYNRFLPGTRHVLCVSVSNDRGLGPRSEPCELYIRPVPPQPPLTSPRIKACDITKGTMSIEFDASPNTGGSQQIASVVEVRRQATTRMAMTKRTTQEETIQYFDSVEALERALDILRPKKKEQAKIVPSKYDQGEMVDAIYSEDGRYYRAEVVSVTFRTETSSYVYGVKFIGYDNIETVSESEIRECFRRGEEVTAILYDTTPGAHAAGSTFVVKENLRRLPGEIFSIVKEGYFIKFKGRGVATQKTNAFDVFPVSTVQHQLPSQDSMSNSSTSPPPIRPSSTNELPGDLQNSEWFEACETGELSCVLKGLKPGASYECRLAAASEGGGRGPFGPIHVLRMDPGVPGMVDSPPQVYSIKPNGRVDLMLPLPSDDGGSPVTSFQVQFTNCVVVVPEAEMKQRLVAVDGHWQSTGQTYDLPPSSQQVVVSYVHPVAGCSLVFRHRVRNRVGWGPWSSSSAWTLVEIPPGPPSSVTALEAVQSSSSLPLAATVSFKQPDKTNGSAVTSFTLQYKKISSSKSKSVPSDWISHTLPPALTSSMQLTPLLPGASYEVRVQAANEMGAGPWSTISFKLPGVAPTQVPSNVQIQVKSHREFSASWDFVAEDEIATGGEPVFFETQFVPFPPGTAPPMVLSKDVIVEGQTASMTFVKSSKTQLKPDASYWFRVRAANLKGHSAFSPWVHFVMSPAPTEIVMASKLQVEKVLVRECVTSSDLAVSLVLDILPSASCTEELKQGKFPLRVEFAERGSSSVISLEIKEWSLSSSQGWITVLLTTGELRSETTYLCRVQFVRNGIRGEFSRSVPFTTKPAPPPVVAPVTTPSPPPSMTGEEIKTIKMSKLAARKVRTWRDAIVQNNQVSFVVFAIGMICAVKSMSILLFVSAVIIPVCHLWVFETFIPPRPVTKADVELQDMKREIAFLSAELADLARKGPPPNQMRKVKTMKERREVLKERAFTMEQDQERIMSWLSKSRLEYKREVLKLCSGMWTLHLFTLDDITTLFPEYNVRIRLGMFLSCLITALFYFVPGEMRQKMST